MFGALISTIFSYGEKEGKLPLHVEKHEIFQQIVLEALGCFLFTFIYLCSTERKTKFTSNSAVQTLILACSYVSAMLLAGERMTQLRISPVNPAVSFAIILFNPTEPNWETSYIFFIFSFVGSALAFLFFKHIYLESSRIILNEKEADEEPQIQEKMIEDKDLILDLDEQDKEINMSPKQSSDENKITLIQKDALI